MQNSLFTPTQEHSFCGQWITSAEFVLLPIQNVYHRQLDEAARRAIAPRFQNRHILFRKEFVLDVLPTKATLFFSADDYAKVWVNGMLAGQGPGAGYPRHTLYLALDVTRLLHLGRNTLAIHSYYSGLINRVWTSGDNVHGFLCDLVCDDECVVASDRSFRCRAHSGYAACGKVGYETQFMECYDASSSEVGFESPDFDDSHWGQASLADSSRWALFPSPLPPVQQDAMVPSTLREGPGWICADFGSQFVGTFRMRARGPAGAALELRFGQELNDDGSVRYAMRCGCTYQEYMLLSGKKHPRWMEEGWDVLEQFDYKAFRYAEIRFPEGVEIDADSLYLCARHMPFRLAESCAYDDPNIRSIWSLAVRSFCFGVQEQIMDCMDREKGYYLGDGVYTLFAWCHLVGDYAPMRKFVDDFLRTSFITPGLVTCANCSFMQEIAEYPLMLFLLLPVLIQYDDGADFVRARLPQFRAILETYRRDYATESGLLRNLDKWCVVEWPAPMRDGYDVDVTEGRVCTALHNVINAWYVGTVRLYNRLARDLGGAEPFEGEAELIDAFQKTFFDPERNLFRDSDVSQHVSFPGNVYAWFWGLHPTPEASQTILEFVRKKGLTSGMLFTTVPLLATLQREGQDDLVREFLLDENAWLRMLREGATTTFEAWGKDVKWNTSLFHLTLASVVLFLTPHSIGREIPLW